MVGRRQRDPRKVLEAGAGGHIGGAESRPTARVSGLRGSGLMVEVDTDQVMMGPLQGSGSSQGNWEDVLGGRVPGPSPGVTGAG